MAEPRQCVLAQGSRVGEVVATVESGRPPQAPLMTNDKPSAPFYNGRTYRVLGFLMGLGLAGVGLYVAFFTSLDSVLRIGGAIVMIGMGIDAMLAAMRGRQSLLGRIGPLP